MQPSADTHATVPNSVPVFVGTVLCFEPFWSYVRWNFDEILPSVYHLDYVMRTFLLAAIFLTSPARNIVLARLPSPVGFGTKTVAAIYMFAIACFIFFFIEKVLFAFIGDTAYFHWPVYPSTTLKLFDLTAGLLLVAVTEELVFRKFAFLAFDRYSVSPGRTLLYSSLIFAAIHWETGWVNSITAFLFGWLAMTVYMSTRRLWPCILVHYLINLMIFRNIPVSS
ncbi:MAG: CPBP family intramembrane glutamic endopeptidase [Alphaproteobacteria bacterium]